MNDFINITNSAYQRKAEQAEEEQARKARHDQAVAEGYRAMLEGRRMRELRCKAHKWDITEKCLTVIAGCMVMITLCAFCALAQIL